MLNGNLLGKVNSAYNIDDVDKKERLDFSDFIEFDLTQISEEKYEFTGFHCGTGIVVVKGNIKYYISEVYKKPNSKDNLL